MRYCITAEATAPPTPPPAGKVAAAPTAAIPTPTTIKQRNSFESSENITNLSSKSSQAKNIQFTNKVNIPNKRNAKTQPK